MKTQTWEFQTSVVDGDYYQIDGLNIWAHKWHPTGEYVNVLDPIYGQLHTLSVWQIEVNEKRVRFAAIEFSNCVWGIYVEI